MLTNLIVADSKPIEFGAYISRNPNLVCISKVLRINSKTSTASTMKFALAILAVLAVAGPMSAYDLPNFGTGELANELQDFLDIMPGEKMLAILLEYISEDEEFQNVVMYLQSEEFRQLAIDVEALPEIKDLMNYIQNAGLDIYYLVNKLNDFVGIDRLVAPAKVNHVGKQISGGLRGFLDDIKAILPVDQIKELYHKKLAESPVFAGFVAQLQSPEFQKIVNTVYVNQHFQDMLTKAKTAGVDVVALKDFLYAILGISIPSRR